ncbi:hypothetical protein [Streptomyces tendae]|uniref:hypothetical protein n=1 Tax=Streptomyces tendae TaxID=1932 RepID=UPI0033AB45B9
MADFVIAAQASPGVRWTLVELESPVSRLINPDNKGPGGHPAARGRQIEDWRRWLSTNLRYTRSARDAGRLGLLGITAEVPGLIIMDARLMTTEPPKSGNCTPGASTFRYAPTTG